MTLTFSQILFAIPLYLAIEIYLYFSRKNRSAILPTVAFIPVRTTWRTKAIRIAKFLPPIVILFLLLSLTDPKRMEIQREILPSGIDIMVALDISGSMAAEDFKPLNRLAVAKTVLHDFIEGRPSDRVGLILFSGKSISRSPLTLQHAPLLRTLDHVELGNLPEGTAIGSAIVTSINRLSAISEDPGKTPKGSRILVLITDGRNNAGEIHPLDALTLAVQQKIKIYTIGVGGFGSVPFPYLTPEGKKTYRYEKADLDEPLLKKIAAQTGGEYFRASDPASLEALFTRIDILEKSEPRIMQSHSLKSLAFLMEMPALLLVVCYIMLTIIIIRWP
jgi:Ca-activated chloride channel family protein